MKMEEYISALVGETYGPQYCTNCKQMQKIRVYKVAGSDYSRMEGTKLVIGFIGSRICEVCHTTIPDNGKKLDDEEFEPGAVNE